MINIKKYKIPNHPGVYFFKKGNEVLYIGKATSLKNRIKSYFSNDLKEKRGPFIEEMISKATSIDWEKTETVLEALILEAKLIKKHFPKYNTEGKSDKSWNYVCITKEKIPKVLIVREKQINFLESRFLDVKLQAIFGPFTNSNQLKEVLKIIRRIFPYMDKVSSKSMNYSFYRQTELAPDILTKEGKRIYLLNIKNIRSLFQGKKKMILRNIKKEMFLSAKNKEFELAGEYKRQYFALKHINDIALLKNNDSSLYSGLFRIEAYDVAHLGGKDMVGAMTVVESLGNTSVVVKNEYKKFKIRTRTGADDTGALMEVLERRFTHREWRYPNLLVVDGSTPQINVAKRVLRKIKITIPIVSVVKDDRHKPKGIEGDRKYARKYESEILLANNEAHRFAITFHKNLRRKSFLKNKKI
ncbi:MAG: GIY-YIG nuclease family protein [Candidatus Paceibacterota bacterium]